MILYADFESIVHPVDEKYREKMNKMKTERKGKSPYTEKINAPVPSGWCVPNTITCGDIPDPSGMYPFKYCLGKFKEHIEDGVKGLYATFLLQTIIKLSSIYKFS